MGPAKLSWKNVSGSNSRPFSSDAPCTKTQRLRKITNQTTPLSVIILRHTVAGRVKIEHGHRRIGGIVPNDSHRAIAQLGSRAKVEVDRDLDGGGPGPGSSDNLTLDLVSAAAVNAPSLINKMTRGRYWPHCLLMCRFLGRRDKDAIHTLGQPASEKRQGTKSREGIRVAMRRALSRTEHRT